MFRFLRYLLLRSWLRSIGGGTLLALSLGAAWSNPNPQQLLKQIATFAGVGPAGGSAGSVPAAGSVEYAFSPNAGAEQLVLKVITGAQREIRVMAYALTSAPITQALLAARRRGVEVYVIADHKQNTADDRSGKGRAALSALANAGAAVRTTEAFAIHHDKVLVQDGRTVLTGSFNFSAAAAKSNSENVLVLWDNPGVAKGYLQHFERNWRTGQEWRVGY